jgi:4-amino-4-deoxy-L-arabinose transferase-like glycosyltransferase
MTRGHWLTHPALILGALTLALHAYANQHYGFFRDELYFIVCGRHPDWGYVDQPPLVPLIAAFTDWLAPGSLTVLRALSAVIAAANIVATVSLVRMLGGRAFAGWIAGLCVLLAPIQLIEGLFLFTDLFLPLAWIGCSALLIRMLRTGDQRGWIPFGVIVGFALWSKYLLLFNLIALALALPFTPLRRALITRWPYLGALIALAIIAPNLIWQWRHDWPFIELGAAGASGKNLAMSLPAYLWSQVMLLNPGAAIVWIAGLAAVTFSPRWRLYRLFALQWAALMLIELASHGKDYYAASLYPPLFAFGAAAIESLVRPSAARGALVAVVVAVGLIGMPMAIPVLPIDTFIAYQNALGAKPVAREHNQLGAPLPQTFADMFGWREMAKTVSDAYWALPENERAKAVFFGNNYGEAAAIDVFGDHLPPAIASHNNYFLWGPRGHDGAVVIELVDRLDRVTGLYESVETVGRTESPYAMPGETGLLLVVCRGRKASLIADWPSFKNYN